MGNGVCIWNAATGELVQRLEFDSGKTRVEFSPNGQRLVVSTGYELVMFEAGTWKKLRTLAREGDDGWPGGLGFSPDGLVLAAAYSRDRYQLLHAETLQRLAILEGSEPGSIGSLSFSPDGNQLAHISNFQIHLWDLFDLRRQLAEMALDWNAPKLVSSDRVRNSSTGKLVVEFATGGDFMGTTATR